MAATRTVLGPAASVIIAAAMLAASGAAFALVNMTAVTKRRRQVPAHGVFGPGHLRELTRFLPLQLPNRLTGPQA